MSSPRIRRSPVKGNQIAENSSCPTSKNIEEKGGNTPLENTQQQTEDSAPVIEDEKILEKSSPRQEFIAKMRQLEEETLAKCQSVIRKMRSAMARQRNISRDVQDGVSELEELFDVMESYRSQWKTTENERKTSRTVKCCENNRNICEISTPVSSLSKRAAPSPPKNHPEKKAKNVNTEKSPLRGKNDSEEWKTVKSKRTINRENKERKLLARERPGAVVIRPTQGHSYSDVLRNIRSKIKPEDSDIAVRNVRKTKTGALLIEMGKGGRKDEFRESLRRALGSDAIVKDLTPTVTVEIRDLDALTTNEEVLTAVEKETGEPKAGITVRLTEANIREQRKAFISITAGCANKLLKSQRIKIGWTSCRVLLRKELVRCFRCFGTGHRQWECKGPDRKGMDLCIRCGEKGHRKKDCVNMVKCCICSIEPGRPSDHLPGSRGCIGHDRAL